MIDKNQTIASIKKIKSSSVEATNLTRRVNDLIFNKKIGDFDAEDLRLLIGQHESLELCIPLAIELLKSNPMIEGDYFHGDLLKNVLSASPDFWIKNPRLKKVVENVFITNKDLIFNYDVSDDIKEQLKEGFERFLNL